MPTHVKRQSTLNAHTGFKLYAVLKPCRGVTSLIKSIDRYKWAAATYVRTYMYFNSVGTGHSPRPSDPQWDCWIPAAGISNFNYNFRLRISIFRICSMFFRIFISPYTSPLGSVLLQRYRWPPDQNLGSNISAVVQRLFPKNTESLCFRSFSNRNDRKTILRLLRGNIDFSKSGVTRTFLRLGHDVFVAPHVFFEKNRIALILVIQQ